MRITITLAVTTLVGVLIGTTPAAAAEWYVAPGGGGGGTSGAPFGRVQDALNAAQAGDTIIVRAGTYNETLTTVRPGTSGAPIVLRTEQGPGTVLVTANGRVANFTQAYIVVDGFVFDGQYGLGDAIRVTGGANFLILRNTEVRRATNDLIDMSGPTGVLFENCLLHHALNAANGRTDAHAIAASAVRDFTIRNCEIHTFSGDGIQVDPGRLAPGWTNVLIEHTRFWVTPLPAPENGFPAGVVTGENAVDTKASTSFARATIVIRDVVASGFRDLPSSAPPNQAAFNLKEYVDAIVDGVTVYDSEIAFRLRGPAQVLVKNAVVYNTLKAFRYEDNITDVRIWNDTIGLGVPKLFEAASASPSALDTRNLLVLGSLPSEAAGGSNLAVGANAFVNSAANDYRLAQGSSAIDVGVTIAEVTTDRSGLARPQGAAYDVGAFEAPAGGGGGSTNVPPVVHITSPSDGSTFAAGQSIPVEVTATDADGSVTQVAFYADGQQLAVDGSAPYSFVWTTAAAGTHTVTAVATDNRSATASSDIHVTVSPSSGDPGGGGTPGGSQTVFTTQAPASMVADFDYEFGMRFVATVDGQVAGIRFWKAAGETAGHTGHLWTASGQLLATVVFSGETASGWQQQLLPSPVAISAQTPYIVSVNNTNHWYPMTPGGLASDVVNGSLVASAGGSVYSVGGGAFPGSSAGGGNFFRDVMFVGGSGTPTPPPPPPPGGGSPGTLLGGQAPDTIVSDFDYELGVSVIPAVDGAITSLRFWKAAGETGAHTGRLWSAGGQLLGSVTFANESSSGWQEQALPSQIQVTAGAAYVVTVNNTNHLYPMTPGGFATDVVNGPLRAPGGANGVYSVGGNGTFPNFTAGGSNFFRDVVFVPR